MKNKICCFAGHRDIYDKEKIYTDLKDLIEKLITEESVSEFWVGNYGSFDLMCTRAVNDLKLKYSDVQLNLVIPYITHSVKVRKDEIDNVIIADIKEKTPQNLKILKCNEYMVSKSDCLICYVQYNFGGAYKTLQYAKKKKMCIYNLANNKKM